MKIIETDRVTPDQLKAAEREWVYNGLDCCITAEVLDVLLPQLDNLTSSTYAFSKSLQAPVLEMRLRGVKIDSARKAEVIDEYYEKLDLLETQLERIVGEGCGFFGFNWRSNNDLKTLFYDILGIPPIKKGGRVTVDRNALEKMEGYLCARQIVAHMLKMRELGKKISVLKTDIDPDGRMRTSYNIAGTNTGRFSSSFSEFGTGGNMQNIEDSLRSIFVADKGMKMAYLDAEQGESRVVGAIEWNLFKDGRYLDACEGGDLHTTVAKLCWPNLAWVGNLKTDKDIAEQPYYRHYSYRFMCKKIGHGTNYGGKPHTLSNQAKIDRGVVEDFQPKYFHAFPAHLAWHEYVENILRSIGQLISLTGRRRHFWGRRDSDETLREAIAYDPQGSLADIVNTGMLQVWRDRSCEMLMQNHDAIVVQYPEEREDEVIPRVLEGLRVPVELSHDRTLIIPYGVKTGWNFGEHREELTRMASSHTNPAINGSGKRKCQSWIESFVEHTSNLESPEIFRKWVAIGTIAATLEQRVWLRPPGSGSLYPNLYTFLVGHPGLGKSRAISSAMEIFRELPETHIAPTSVTMASLVDCLVTAKRTIVNLPEPMIEYNSLLIVADELSVFMHEYKQNALIPGLTAFYDTNPYGESRRTTGTNIKIAKPQLNIISGTTPSNLMVFVPEYAWGQGFMSRIMLVFADEKPLLNIFKAKAMPKPTNMIYDLKVMSSLYGEFGWEEEWEVAMHNWKVLDFPPKPTHPRLQYYNERRYAHLMKLSMIAAVDAGNSLMLNKSHFNKAMGWLLEAEAQMPFIFEAGSPSQDSKAMDEIQFFVRAFGEKGVSEHRINNFARTRVQYAFNVKNVIELMERSGMITATSLDRTTGLRIFTAGLL